MDKLRVAIAGCHRMLDTANRGHNWANGFARAPDTTVVAVFDKDQATRERFRAVWRDTWGEMPAYGDYDRMLAETAPDIVCIATRQTMHADQIETAANAGVRGIACEKPLATSLEETDRIVSACTERQVALAFLLDRRWFASYRAIRDYLRDGIVGEVTAVTAYGAPNLINHGCHWYDTALALAGDAEPVWTSGHVEDVSGDGPDSRRRQDPPGRSWTRLDNGVPVATMPEGLSGMSYTVSGTEGSLVAFAVGNDEYENVEAYYTLNDSRSRRTKLPLPEENEGWLAGRAAVQDLADAVRSGGSTSCDVDEARRSTEIGFAIHASDRAGGARVGYPVSDRTQRIESFPWGNE